MRFTVQALTVSFILFALVACDGDHKDSTGMDVSGSLDLGRMDTAADNATVDTAPDTPLPDALPEDSSPEDAPPSIDTTDAAFDTPCQSFCEGKECGSDGCGGSCGVCGAEAVCVAGACDDLSGDLLAQYRFEGNCQDSSPNGLDGTPAGISFQEGMVGSAAAFDGLSSWIVVPHDPAIALGSSFTLALWLNRVLDQSLYHPGEEFAILLWKTDTLPPIKLFDNGSLQAFNTKAVVDAAWTHVAWTLDAESGLARVFIDGALVEEKAFGLPLPASTAAFEIGHKNSGPGGSEHHYTYHGLMDDLRVYGAALSPSQVQGIYKKAQEELPQEPGAKVFYGDDWFQLPNDEIQSPKTYSLWLWPKDLQTEQTVLIKKDAPGESTRRPIQIDVLDGNVRAMIVPEGSGNKIIGSALIDDAWTHVAVEVSPMIARMYVNGVAVGEIELDGEPIDNEQAYTVGAIPSVADYIHHFHGEVFGLEIRPGFVFDGTFDPCELYPGDGALFVQEGGGMPGCL